jgi:aminoglycoside 6-adenylyltransferase
VETGITEALSPPTYTEYIIQKPTRDEYEELINDFWWDASYVPKYLWRDQLPFAKYMFAQAVHDIYLRRIIEWYIGLQNDWSVDTGLGGRYFKRFLEPEMWGRVESTYAGFGLEENWEAFFNAVSLFCGPARTVGESLGYAYPVEMERRMVAYFRMIRETE